MALIGTNQSTNISVNEITERMALFQCPNDQLKKILRSIHDFDRNSHFDVIPIKGQTI